VHRHAVRPGDEPQDELIREEGPLELERALWILSQAASALDAAHRAGLVHRDVKPGNILIATGSETGAAEHMYLSDFGLTKRTSSDSGMTATGRFVGTLDYAAPEQFEGRPLDARTDIYSLGCVFYECLTGEVPYKRENEAGLVYASWPSAEGDRTSPRASSEARPGRRQGDGQSPRGPLPHGRSDGEGSPGGGARRGRPSRGVRPSRSAIGRVCGGVRADRCRGGHHRSAHPRRGFPSPAVLPTAPADSVAMIDPATNRMVGWRPVLGYPDQIVASGDSLWVSRAPGHPGWTSKNSGLVVLRRMTGS
jgi:serine/threonine protein kinase